MRTIIIWDQCGQDPIRFFILKGDYTHLDGVYINQVGSDEDKERQLNGLVYNDDAGTTKVELLPKFPKLQPGDKVIVAGFLP